MTEIGNPVNHNLNLICHKYEINGKRRSSDDVRFQNIHIHTRPKHLLFLGTSRTHVHTQLTLKFQIGITRIGNLLTCIFQSILIIDKSKTVT